MPLLLHRNINSNVQMGLWQITESIDELVSMLFLNKEEFDQLESFKSDVRRKQWLSYRVLIRNLVKSDFIYRIYYDEYNKPYLVNPQRSISISHCSEFSAVLISDDLNIKHGIDIEPIDKKILRVVSKFLNPYEKLAWDIDKDVTKADAYWSMKEAIFKIYGKSDISLRENIFIKKFELDQSEKTAWIVKNGEIFKFKVNLDILNGLVVSTAFEI